MTTIKSFDITVPVRQLPPLTAEALTRALADLGLRVVLPSKLRIDEELRYTPVRVLLEGGRELRTGLSLVWEARKLEADEVDEADGDEAEAEDDADLEDEDEDEDDAGEEDDEEESGDVADADDDGEEDDEEESGDEAFDEESEDDADADETPLIEGEVGQVSIWAKNAPIPADPNEVPLALYFAAAIARLGDGEVLVHEWDGGARAAEDVIEELDPSGFDPEQEAWTDFPYDLFLAAEDGDAFAVGQALDAGASTEALNNQGVTPLMMALAKDRPAAAWELLRRGANARAVNYFGKIAAQYADNCSDEWLRGELARRARFPHDELFELVAEGDSNGVLAALTAGAPIDAATPEGFTLLMAAVRAEDENLVDALLRRGADASRRTVSGRSALDIAVAVGNVALQKVLQATGG